MVLNRIGFPFVYGAMRPSEYEGFRFEWRDNLDDHRDGRNLRCVFVASRHELDAATLVPLLNA